MAAHCVEEKRASQLMIYFGQVDLQSNFDTMPPFRTERKWHSSEGGIVTRICKNSLVM